MKKILFAFLALISLKSFAQQNVINDANAEKRTLSGSFSAIKVSSGIQLYLTQGDEESIAVSASDPKYMERFKTEVEGGTLHIYFDSKGISWLNTDKRKLKAYVSFKTLQRLHGSSGADVYTKSVLKLPVLTMEFNSGARFDGEVDIDDLATDQGSGSEISISGKAAKLKVDVSSGAIFKGFDLVSEYCDAKASSGGGARISVSKELAAKASSGGGVRYKGAAVIRDLDVSSGGVVKKAD